MILSASEYTKHMRPLATLLLSTLFMVLTFSVPLALHAEHLAPSTPMEHCPFMTHTDTVCPMSFTAHLAAWQSLLSHIPTSAVSLMLLMSLLLVALYTHLYARVQRTIYKEPSQSTYNQTPHRHAASFHQLCELFSQGILHPKLF
jgi:hypothetical protein